MATVDLGMEEEAQSALERAEAERLAHRQREQAEREAAQRAALAQMADRAYPAAGTSAQVMADVERDTTRQVGTSPQHGVLLSGPTRGTQPMAPEARARIAGVEQRLQAGDRAGVEADTQRLQQGASPPSPESLVAPPPRMPMRQEAVTAASPAPMRQEAIGTGSDPGMAARPPAIGRPTADANPLPRMGGTVAGLPLDPRVTGGPPALRDPFQGDAPMVRKPDGAAAPAARLDAGLPTDSDISDARTRDAIRSPFRAIGRALQAGAGMRPGPRAQDEAEVLQERRDAGMRERMAGKATMRREEREASDRDTQVRDRDAARALDSRRLDLDERRIGMQAEGLEDERSQRRAALEQSVAEREARRSASSPQSQAAQNALLQRIATYRSTGNAQLAASLERVHGGEAGIRRMSAEQLAPLLERTGGLPQVHMRGRAGGGGTGAPGPRLAGREAVSAPQQAQERIRQAVERGMDPAHAEQLEADGDLARMMGQDALARGPQARAEQYGERLQQSGLAQADQALAAVERFVRQHPGDLPGQGVLDTWGGLRPGWAQTPEGREFQRLTRRLLDSELRQATGANAPESEVQTFRQILGLSETSSDEDVLAALQQGRQYIDSEFTALRGAYGPEAIEIWERQARAGRGMGTQGRVSDDPGPSGSAPARPRTAPARSETVRVRLPDGRTGSVPRDRLERALAAGAEVVE